MGNLAKVVHGVGGVPRAAADSREEQSPTLLPQLDSEVHEALDRAGVQPSQNFCRFLQILLSVVPDRHVRKAKVGAEKSAR